MGSYYAEKLAAQRLRLCYELATPEVQEYLAVEIDRLRSRIHPGDRVLELGCGYGRVLREIAAAAGVVVGGDISAASLVEARHYLADRPAVHLVAMNALFPPFAPGGFDLVFGIQNSLSAFHVDARAVVSRAVALTRPGGRVLFASYAPEFWPHRLEWFRRQAAAGLIGEIDETASGAGRIVCRDGFTAVTTSAAEFREMSRGLGRAVEVVTVAGSSVFCEITV